MTRRWGIEAGYRDAFGKRREIEPWVLERLRGAMPEPADGAEPVPEPVAVVRPGGRLPRAGEVVLEDGTDLGRLRALPPDVPFGYHALRLPDREVRLLTGPGACVLPADRSWGWAVQLYAARSASSWGNGDLGDLRDLAAWSARLGAGLLVVNPLSAAAPVVPIQRSPYFPSSRRFRNPVYLRVEAVPGASALGEELDRLTAAGRALNDRPRIDRDAAYRLKVEALEQIWRHRPPVDGFDRYRAEMGEPLRQWATYAVLAERHGASWAGWPEELRRPGTAAVERHVAAHADRVAFHEWLQWLLDEQLAAANDVLPLVQDMPVGVDRHGADAWAWQDELALDATIGAPPDVFNQAGQEWGLPPFAPDRLRAARYEPFIQTVRATLRHAGGARIDHALGLFRLWCIPLGEDPRNGAYVRFPTDELLEILAIESHRAGAPIVGEDLGTVEPRVRRELARRRVLSYKLVYFERRPPSTYAETALAAVTTHDLPTIAGTWLRHDLEVQRRAGVPPDHAGLKLIRGRLARAAGVKPTAELDEVILRVHQALAASPAMIVTAALEDALRVPERTNLPGTIDEHPNWSIPLPVPLETIRVDPFVGRLAASLRRG